MHVRYVEFFFFKQKTAYEMRISDWSSDVCSSDLGFNWTDGAESPAAGRLLELARSDCDADCSFLPQPESRTTAKATGSIRPLMSILPLCRAPLLRCVAQATISVAHGDSNQNHPGRARHRRKLCSTPSRPAGEERGWAAIHTGVGL